MSLSVHPSVSSCFKVKEYFASGINVACSLTYNVQDYKLF